MANFNVPDPERVAQLYAEAGLEEISPGENARRGVDAMSQLIAALGSPILGSLVDDRFIEALDDEQAATLVRKGEALETLGLLLQQAHTQRARIDNATFEGVAQHIKDLRP